MMVIFNDGGREDAGFKGRTGDCVTRAVAIASGLPYKEVYNALAHGTGSQRGAKKARSARNGINTRRKWFKDYMLSIGFKWVATMQIGSGCRVHLKADELPLGNIIVALSKHYAAVIDGVLHDTFNCSRNGRRCVYGYWIKE